MARFSWVTTILDWYRSGSQHDQPDFNTRPPSSETDSNYWYVVEITSGPEKIFLEPISSKNMVRSLLGDANEQSVFKVYDDVEEVEVLAARYLALTSQNSITHRTAMRVYPRDLIGTNIEIKQTDGLTGVSTVDRKHFDMILNKQSFEDLMNIICESHYVGVLRFRRIATTQIERQLRNFIANIATVRIEQKKLKQCRKLLEVYDKKFSA